MRLCLGSALLFFAAAATFGQSAKHPFNADDWAAIHSISPREALPGSRALLANRDAGKLNSPRNVRLKRACTDWTGKAEAPRSTRADQ
jgi:hypothetical protein